MHVLQFVYKAADYTRQEAATRRDSAQKGHFLFAKIFFFF